MKKKNMSLKKEFARKKGFSLPISVVIIIVVAALILVYLSTFFLGVTGTHMSRAQAEQVYTSGCMDFCGASENTLLNGYRTAYSEESSFTRFREACTVLDYIEREPASPENNARGVLSCLRTCGNCYIEEGETGNFVDNIGNIANSGINNP